MGTAEMEMIKILLNSVVSTQGAAFCSADVTNFYLNTPMEQEEYVCVHISLIPEEIIQEYQLQALINSKGHILGCVEKGMYGLPQAGILAKKLLKARLSPHCKQQHQATMISCHQHAFLLGMQSVATGSF
jgi:hypothetical protein